MLRVAVHRKKRGRVPVGTVVDRSAGRHHRILHAERKSPTAVPAPAHGHRRNMVIVQFCRNQIDAFRQVFPAGSRQSFRPAKKQKAHVHIVDEQVEDPAAAL